VVASVFFVLLFEAVIGYRPELFPLRIAGAGADLKERNTLDTETWLQQHAGLYWQVSPWRMGLADRLVGSELRQAMTRRLKKDARG
jgi:hypothetical protein